MNQVTIDWVFTAFFSFLQLTFLYGQETEIDKEIVLNVEWKADDIMGKEGGILSSQDLYGDVT